VPELDNTLERPPHTYSKDPASLWARLLSVFTIEIDAIQATREAIQAAHDIDQATGKTLDFIGANVQQGRGKTNDGLYRILIKSKIARNICQGSIDELIKTIALTMNCLESEVSIIEQWELTPATEAALIITVPDYALLNVGMTPGQFTQFMGKLVAAGVICAPGTAFGEGPGCEGHLRFSYAASEENINKGLGIVKRVVDGLD
jgi:hypothetical protein